MDSLTSMAFQKIRQLMTPTRSLGYGSIRFS
jgi:hypothetical protein